MHFVLTSGERHEVVAFPELVQGGNVKRPGRGRPNIVSAIYPGIKLIAAKRFDNSYKELGQLLSSLNGATRNGGDGLTGVGTGSVTESSV